MARLSRRDFLRLSAAGVGALIYTACKPAPPGGAATPTASASSASTWIPSPTREAIAESAPKGQPEQPEGFTAGRLTPVADFYVQSYDGVRSPALDQWVFDVTGLVENPLRLTWSDFSALPTAEVMHTLECIGNPVGGELIGNAMWRGVPFRALLDRAGLRPSAAFVGFSCEDEYTTTVPLEKVMHERSLLAFEMEGKALSATHGYPARALIPGVYGQKQPKWVIGVHITDRYSDGTWEKDGWSDEAAIQINSRIETPPANQRIPAGEPYYVTGVAFSDLSGVQGVEVSVDGGETWEAAELFAGPHESVWTLWAWKWENPTPGRHEVMARAADGAGQMQSKVGGFLSGVFPNGTSDMHRVSINVVQEISGSLNRRITVG